MKPILFNTEMVKAILKGRKTVTRRVVKPTPPKNAKLELLGDKRHAMDLSIEVPGPNDHRIYTPPYLLGDTLYVRETWQVWRAHRYESNADIQFKAGGDGIRVCFANGWTDSIDRDDYDRFVEKWYPNGKWNPSIHMPKVAARIFLRVTDVRVEHLQDIDEDGVCFEGAESIISACEHIDYSVTPPGPCYYTHHCKDCIINHTYPELFGAMVWDSTVKHADLSRYGWDANPWVWVIEFERCEKPKEG